MRSLGAEVLSIDQAKGLGTLRLNDGALASFPLESVTGFVPLPGVTVVAQLAPDGAVLRVHLPSHPSKADRAPSPDGAWVTVLRDAALLEDLQAFEGLLTGMGAPRPRLAIHPPQPNGRRVVELVWPTTHMLLTETPAPFALDGVDRRALPQGFLPGSHQLALLPAIVDPLEERRALGADFPDPWADQGTLRRASRLLRALLSASRGFVLHRAGQLALAREDGLRRLGDLSDLEARPFGAWIDWALTEDRRAYRTLGMATLAGEDVEIALSNPDAEVELDSAESALLFACMLQVRETRFLADGELFHVPKDVRVGARGASATASTGYRYFVHRGHARVQLVRG